MGTSLHRINDYSLLKFIETNKLSEFHKIKSELLGDYNQYLSFNDLEKTVWDSGVFSHRVNKTYSSLNLYTPDISIQPLTNNYQDVRLMIKQGYNWNNIYGLHIIIKSSKTNDVLISRICQLSDFQITNNQELINGSFWLEEVSLKIPKINDILTCQITEVTFDDIVNDGISIGLILNYPNDFIPLIDEKPVPDHIKTILSFDNNHYLTIEVKTTENKTLEQSILDYFEINFANIKISHVINYGNETLGYKTIRLSNEDDIYGSLNIGLNLLDFAFSTDKLVTIFVSTEIEVDTKLMKREVQTQTDLDVINPLIVAQITHPDTNFPVEVKSENIIQQTIVEAKETTKLISIYQPVFVDFIKSDLILTNKTVFFEKVVNQTYLRINKSEKCDEQLILSKITSDNQIYFDLSELVPIEEQTTYDLIDIITTLIIGSGKVLLKS